MNLQTLANLGQFLGGLAVIASLVYLALQVRQNTQSIRTENYARALDRIAAIQSQPSRDTELSRIFSKGVADVSRLTARERLQFTWALYEVFGAFEFMFHAAKIRALPEDVWARWSSTVAWWLSFPGVHSWWRHRPTPFSSGFSSFVENILDENVVDIGAARRWQAFVAGEGASVESVAPAAQQAAAAAERQRVPIDRQ
ncbi:MAG: hypothetical protein NAOJABEB_00750 [Steroidobacteraceae bacterium]|nr:hypothetical protein [Steroidobacteraceae bacterium]